MLGVSRKIFRETVEDIANIVSIHHENVNTLQEALVHLGDAVQEMNKLIEVQNARLNLLEQESKNGRDN